MVKKKTKVKVGERVSHDPGEKTIRKEITADVEVEAVAESKPAIVEDDIVTCRGRGYGGVTRMKRSEYNEMQKRSGKN